MRSLLYLHSLEVQKSLKSWLETTRHQESGHLALCGKGGQDERDHGTGSSAWGCHSRLDGCNQDDYESNSPIEYNKVEDIR